MGSGTDRSVLDSVNNNTKQTKEVNTRMKNINLKKTFALVLSAAMVVTTITGFGSARAEAADETRTIVDMAGVEVTIPAEVDTYVESWFAHNAVDVMLDDSKGMLVTCANPDSYKWMYLVCPNMEDTLYAEFSADMGLEEIVALAPDVVFGSNENYREMFDKVNIPYINVMFSNLEEMKKSIALTAEVLGDDSPAIAEEYIAYLDEQVANITAVAETIADEDKATILHGDALANYTCDGGNTIIDEWITDVGAVNVAAEGGIMGNKQTVTIEEFLIWNPEFIISGAGSAEVETILNDETWADIQAVQDGNVYVNPKGVFTWDRYGVELALQLQWTAQLVYPDLFADLDIIKATQEFYTKFFDYDLTEDQVKLMLARENPAE